MFQGRKERCVYLAFWSTPSTDRDVRSVPFGTLTPYLYLQPGQGRRRVHDCGTEVAADVEHDRSHFARPGEMVHDYDATDTGVAAGFL